MNFINLSGVTAADFRGAAVRVIMREGEPWFVLADVCKVLEIGNAPMAASRLDDDEKMTISTTDSHSGQRGGAQSLTIINESGLYSLILASRKPEAKVFKKWVTGTVLPEIRRTGSYHAPMSPISFDLSDPEFALALCTAHAKRALLPTRWPMTRSRHE